jgi:hypothetical protein
MPISLLYVLVFPLGKELERHSPITQDLRVRRASRNAAIELSHVGSRSPFMA